MPKAPLPLTGGFYKSRSLPISAQECLNYYVHINQGGGLSEESLFGTPGLHQLETSGNSLETNRGAWVMDGIAYEVNGTTLYRLTRTISGTGEESFTLDSLGTVLGDERVSMADNGTQLCILQPGGNGYIWVEDTTTFTQITDVDFTANGNPQHVIYNDGYFLFTTDSKKFIISALNDGLAYNALDFGSAEADPDDIVVPTVINNQVMIGGGNTFEPFQNIGGSGFPYQRIEGGVIDTGVYAAFSLIKAFGTFFFIGGGENEEPGAYVFTGADVALISHDGIATLLEELTEEQLSNVFGWSYSQNGARFVGWTLPTTTIVYDLISKRWHERKSFDIVDDVSTLFRWRVNSVIRAYNKIIVGDNIDGRVGELDLEFYDEYDQNIVSRVATLPFSNQGDHFKVQFIELTCESGVGNTDDPEPLISMDRSLDGKTWTPRRERKLGKVGEYKKRQIWRRNGDATKLEIFRYTITAKVKKVLIKLNAKIL